MSYTSCTTKIANSIQGSCTQPIVPGYTGRGVLIDLTSDITWTVDATNPRVITGISIASPDKFVAIDNVWTDAFTGSNTASNNENGRSSFTKTFTFRVPLRGAATSKDIIEPLMNSSLGFAVVLEKDDRSGDGSYEIVGYLKGLKANADGITRNEYENGADWMITMSTNEQFAEVVLFDTNYATTQAAFETMLTNTY